MTRKLKLAGVLVAVVAICALTTASAQARFTSAGYGWTGNGSSASWVWSAFGATVTCTENTFDLEKFANNQPVDGPTETVTVTSHHTKCDSFLPVTVNLTGCDRVFHSPPFTNNLTTDLVCPAGVKGIDITFYSSADHTSAVCHIVFTPYTAKGGLTATNNGNHILVKGALDLLVAHQERTNFLCPTGTETNTGKETIQAAGITFSGSNGAISIS